MAAEHECNRCHRTGHRGFVEVAYGYQCEAERACGIRRRSKYGDRCAARTAKGTCRNMAVGAIRDGKLEVCGVHRAQAARWLARGDLPAWYLVAADYGEQLTMDAQADGLPADERITIRLGG